MQSLDSVVTEDLGDIPIDGRTVRRIGFKVEYVSQELADDFLTKVSMYLDLDFDIALDLANLREGGFSAKALIILYRIRRDYKEAHPDKVPLLLNIPPRIKEVFRVISLDKHYGIIDY
jgi:hypothetical protein